jgi:hypothetical protein
MLSLAWVCAILAFPADASARIERLRWQQSDLTNVAGFKVYLGTASGSYGPPIDVGMGTLEGGDIYWYDVSVLDGDTVYVAVTAYSASGPESVLSNELALSPLSPRVVDTDAFLGVLPVILYLILDDDEGSGADSEPTLDPSEPGPEAEGP